MTESRLAFWLADGSHAPPRSTVKVRYEWRAAGMRPKGLSMIDNASPGYLRFLVLHRRYLAFGFLLTCVSNLGQTFFIGQFKHALLAEFTTLDHASYGWYYSAATLSSAVCLTFLGRRIDDIDLRRFTTFVLVGLFAATTAMSIAHQVWLLWLALFGLRLFGQGLSGHTANTATARYFDRERGRALSVVNLGQPLGEAVLPLIVRSGIVWLGWRRCWQVGAACLALFVLPSAVALLRGHRQRHTALLERVARESAGKASATQRSAREVLRDAGFYLLLPAVLAPAFVTTGLMFHQDVLKRTMSWSDELFATSFIAYSVMQVSIAPIAGVLVDRYGAARLLPAYLVPYGTALACAALVRGDVLVFVLMGGAGLSNGIAFSVIGSLWAERYGVLHLGAIRTLVTVAAVISTAASPPLVGELIERGISMNSVCLMFCGYCGIATTLMAVALRRKR